MRRARAAKLIPLAELPSTYRESVRQVLAEPTLYSQGPAEVFPCRPDLYHWLLEHPDRGATAWRRLGARCVQFHNRGEGVFGWSDALGSDIRWQTVYRGPRARAWYAEGEFRAAAMLPKVPVRLVVLLEYAEGEDSFGRRLLRHQAHVFLQTDSRTAQLLARLLGPSAPRLAEQSLAQLEMFFSALVWYLDRHPDQAERLLLN